MTTAAQNNGNKASLDKIYKSASENFNILVDKVKEAFPEEREEELRNYVSRYNNTAFWQTMTGGFGAALTVLWGMGLHMAAHSPNPSSQNTAALVTFGLAASALFGGYIYNHIKLKGIENKWGEELNALAPAYIPSGTEPD
ncbi:MAG: hypothetical protein LRY76_06960 [Alphaproteobacteria bacterium]|nr:hypothetical protein [Alphaproteobacteria bacterium]